MVPNQRRDPRWQSHALIELRKYRCLPFGVRSASLLDLSSTGLRIELADEREIHVGQRFWVSIPLSPLGVESRKPLLCRIECKWFLPERYRLGGVFIGLSDEDRTVLLNLLEHVRNRSEHHGRPSPATTADKNA